MDYVQFQVPAQQSADRAHEQWVRMLDLLIEEEKRLEVTARNSDGLYKAQALADLTVNHSRTADLLVVLWGLQAETERGNKAA